MNCTDPNHEKCENCGDCIRKGRYADIRVIATDEQGWPVYDQSTGELKHVLIAMPLHVLTHTRFDPTGFVGVFCEHGLPDHPDPEIDAYFKRRHARSFVRARYAVSYGPAAGRCVMDEGQERPDDLTRPWRE
jgi:hypothetical protein